MKDLRIVILGAGAVGGYLGARLLAAGCDVTFIARPNRLEQLAERGLIVKSPLGDSTQSVRAVRQADQALSPHVVILACKATALQSAIASVTSSVGPETRILPVLNGVAHMDTLRDRWGEDRLLGGIVHGALTLAPDGVIHHLSPFFTAIIGAATPRHDAVAARLVECLGATHVDARLTNQIQQEMWNKFVFLATLAGITCLMRTSIGTIMACPGGPKLTERLFAECHAVAQREGYPPPADAVKSYLSLLTAAGSNLTSSMLRDIRMGHPTEAQHVIGDMLRRATRHGLNTPVLATCATHMDCYEYDLRTTPIALSSDENS